MSLCKNILLYLIGIFLLVFGNKNALSILTGEKSKENQPAEKQSKSHSSIFGTIELDKSKSDSIETPDRQTVIEPEDSENATASE